MGGIRLEKYWTAEMRSVVEKYRQFETLIPSQWEKGLHIRAKTGVILKVY